MFKRIHNDIKTAMLNKDEVTKNVLKMIINKANAIAKEAKVETPTDEMVIKSIKSELKQLEQTMSMLKDGNKDTSELYIQSKQQAELLKTYLPKQLSKEELYNKIVEFINQNNIDITNRGLVMKELMSNFKDVADGKMISVIVNEIASKRKDN